MKRPPDGSPPESYHRRLGIPRPDLTRLIGRRDLKLLDWLVAALLERGGPMAPEEVAERLEAVGVRAATGDLPLSLKRAAAPSPNVFRDDAGRLALDLGDPQHPDLRYRLLALDLLERTVRPQPEPAVAPPPSLPPDDEPLSWEEVEGAFRDGWMSLTGTRQAAMILDTAAGGPLTIDEIERRLAGLGARRSRLNLARPYTWVRPPLRSRADGALGLDPDASQLPTLRRLVREEGRKAEEQRAGDARTTAVVAGIEKRRRLETNAARREASSLRRVLLHLVPASGEPRAAVLLDPASRRIESFVGDELTDLPRRLAAYDLVVGIDPRRTLDRLGEDPAAFRRADLDRPQKTLTLGPGRRLLRITNPLLVGATLGIRRPLADDATHRRQLAAGQVTRLRRRLEREAELLWAYYRYGVLHRRVALRWGPLDEWLRVSWPLLGDPSLSELIADAEATGRRLEIILGGPPPWEDPWSSSSLAEPRKVGRGGWLLHLFGAAFLDSTRDDIFEARLTDELPSRRRPPPPQVRLELTVEERDLVLAHCTALDPATEQRLRLAAVEARNGGAVLTLVLAVDDLGLFIGDVAFAANHTADQRLEHRLSRLCQKLEEAERRTIGSPLTN